MGFFVTSHFYCSIRSNKRYADLHFFGILLLKFVIVTIKVPNSITPFYWMRPYAYLEAKRIESAWVSC